MFFCRFLINLFIRSAAMPCIDYCLLFSERNIGLNTEIIDQEAGCNQIVDGSK